MTDDWSFVQTVVENQVLEKTWFESFEDKVTLKVQKNVEKLGILGIDTKKLINLLDDRVNLNALGLGIDFVIHLLTVTSTICLLKKLENQSDKKGEISLKMRGFTEKITKQFEKIEEKNENLKRFMTFPNQSQDEIHQKLQNYKEDIKSYFDFINQYCSDAIQYLVDRMEDVQAKKWSHIKGLSFSFAVAAYGLVNLWRFGLSKLTGTILVGGVTWCVVDFYLLNRLSGLKDDLAQLKRFFEDCKAGEEEKVIKTINKINRMLEEI